MQGDQKTNESNEPIESRALATCGAGAQNQDATAPTLYPGLSSEERNEAAANLRRYFEIAIAIAEEPRSQKKGLTHPESVPTVKERSNVDLET